ncbi:MlaD family protein [Mycobacterium vicinigordonae]|uniref:MCE family protein n=1 Tax=Mycobacterium vicinigordonae TaxID=1719132 RepID=A0A7D6IKR8_9MYCO|nr:MCE family protein [Mycobacterium vicinigordonae]QLL06500.1 MCE family protein [Mycobacterium vicinigordonae]
MPNSFDLNPRSPSNPRLLALGACFVVVCVIVAGLMIAKSRGKFDDLVAIEIDLVNIGDGLPASSDVKFRGALVGSVSEVTPSQHGGPNRVHVMLNPRYASGIPNNVTARVVPANLFAVSAVQLVDNGSGSGSLRSGSVVYEDRSRPTVLFQDVLTRLRQLLVNVARQPDDNSIGMLTALGKATHGRGRQLTTAGHELNEILAQLNSVIGLDDSSPSTLSALTAAADGLRQVSPELFDALDSSIRPMRTLAEKRWQLTNFLSGGLGTAGTLADGFDHQMDRLITISTEMTPALGVIADHAGEFHGVSTRMQLLANKYYDEAWDPVRKVPIAHIVLGLTPSRTYIRADCPRYGALIGPSCLTAPEVPTAPDLIPALGSMGYPPSPGLTENRPNLAPPSRSTRGAPDEPPLPGPPQETPPSAPNAPAPQSQPPESSAVPAPPGAPPQPSVIGGNVGPVGSRQEKQQLAFIAGGRIDPAIELLLGPLARGANVSIVPEPKDKP